MFSSFLRTHHVPFTATHTRGGTLDLVITKSDQLVEELQVDPLGVLSDHSLISRCMPIQRQPPIVHQCEVRSWSKVDRDEFRAALLSSDLCSIDQRPSTAAGYFDLYHDVLTTVTRRSIRSCAKDHKATPKTRAVDGRRMSSTAPPITTS